MKTTPRPGLPSSSAARTPRRTAIALTRPWSGTVAMRAAACLLGLLMAATFPAKPAKAEAPDPFAAMHAASQIFETDGLDASIAILRKAIDDTRVAGKAHPAMAPAFAMLADGVRHAGDPAEALRLADEGLALAAEPGVDPLAATMLSVSRAYALGAVGRHDEAIVAAEAVLPNLTEAFGMDGTAALREEKAVWIEARRERWLRQAADLSTEANEIEAGGDLNSFLAALSKRREAVLLCEKAGNPPIRLGVALALLIQTALRADEVAEARDAAVRLLGMANAFANEPPLERAALFRIVGGAFAEQERYEMAADFQSRAILLYAEGRDDETAFDRFLEISRSGGNPFAAYDASDDWRSTLVDELIRLGETCRQLAFVGPAKDRVLESHVILADKAFGRAFELAGDEDKATASLIAARVAALMVTSGEAADARRLLGIALDYAKGVPDKRWEQIVRFWMARVDIMVGVDSAPELKQAAGAYLASTDTADRRAIEIRTQLAASLRASPSGRRDLPAILEAIRGAKAGVVSRLDRDRLMLSSDGDLERKNARDVFFLFVSSAWNAASAGAR